MLTSLHLLILLPFLMAAVVPVVYKYIPRIHTGWFVLPIPSVLFAYFAGYLPLILTHDSVACTLSWMPSLGVDFTVYMDGFGLLFALLITGMGCLVVLYSIYYLSKERELLHNFYVYILMFMGAMLGVVLSDNIIVLYVFWELTSISSLLLIAYWYERKKSRSGAQKSMLITIFGGLAMLAGFLLLSIITNSFSIQEMIGLREQITEHALFVPAMILILLGALTKSAQFPFHIWLPDAMEAPTPISAYLHSATMVKAGIYLVARLTPIFGGSMEWTSIVAGCGLLTLFIGSFMAINQNDLKALLAYSTVSQLGLIMCLLGIGAFALNNGLGEEAVLFTTAILTAMFHLINHSVFKGCLFMVVGIVDLETGTRDIRRLGGLMGLMPISFSLAIISGLSMAGLPPFGGFLSKEMFFTSVLVASEHIGSWFALFPVVAFVASVLTFIYCLILILKTFIGPYQPMKLEKKAREAPAGMLIAPVILAALVIIIFFFPNTLSYTILEPTMQSIMPNFLEPGERFEVYIRPWHGWNTELLMTIGIVLLGALLYFFLDKWSSLYYYLPHKLTVNYAYEQGLMSMENLSLKMMRIHMRGFVRDYLVYILTFLIVLLGGSLLLLNIFKLDLTGNAPVSLYELVLALSMVLAALYVVLSKSRVMAIIAVGAVGYILSLFFVIFRAPDLALTQLVVETMTTVLLMLCLYYLPEFKRSLSRVRFQVTNLLIALGVGCTLTLIGLSVQGHRLFEPISNYFEDAYVLAGAKNMVNAILVDFRAFDTMLEIIVLLIAGLGVYTLIKLRPEREENRDEV